MNRIYLRKIISCLSIITSLTLSIRCIDIKADYYIISDGLPEYEVISDIGEPTYTPTLSLDFDVNIRMIGEDGEFGSSNEAYRTGNSELNSINQQINKERIKEQDADEFKKAINHAEYRFFELGIKQPEVNQLLHYLYVHRRSAEFPRHAEA